MILWLGFFLFVFRVFICTGVLLFWNGYRVDLQWFRNFCILWQKFGMRMWCYFSVGSLPQIILYFSLLLFHLNKHFWTHLETSVHYVVTMEFPLASNYVVAANQSHTIMYLLFCSIFMDWLHLLIRIELHDQNSYEFISVGVPFVVQKIGNSNVMSGEMSCT